MICRDRVGGGGSFIPPRLVFFSSAGFVVVEGTRLDRVAGASR